MAQSNIISVSDLTELRERLVRQVVVLGTGCFDIWHVGHLYYLRDARSQGDFLVVGVNSDRSIKTLKGPNRPIIGQDERVELVAAIRYVDYAFIYDDVVADDCIVTLRPNIFAIGESSLMAFPSEAAAAERVGARVYVVTRIPTASTTSIVSSIQSKPTA
jgi:rfaE bifunctional protein nucleotidyltransferase chain/domain